MLCGLRSSFTSFIFDYNFVTRGKEETLIIYLLNIRVYLFDGYSDVTFEAFEAFEAPYYYIISNRVGN